VCSNISETIHHDADVSLEEEEDRRLDALFLDPDDLETVDADEETSQHVRDTIEPVGPAYKPQPCQQILLMDESSKETNGLKVEAIVPWKRWGVEGLDPESSDDEEDDEQDEGDEEEDRALLARIEAELARRHGENEPAEDEEEDDEEEDSAFLARIEAELIKGQEAHEGTRTARAASVESVESEEE